MLCDSVTGRGILHNSSFCELFSLKTLFLVVVVQEVTRHACMLTHVCKHTHGHMLQSLSLLFWDTQHQMAPGLPFQARVSSLVQFVE